MTASTSDPLWFKDAIIYQLHVRAFSDSDADGVGDFAGLTGKLDYLQGLGVTALWLLPFYPSPLRDDGYDIARYDSVHPSYGTLKDFRQFLRAAHDRGFRVITELVINHTSDQHPWFQAARHAPSGSPKRDFYVWSDTNQKYRDAGIIFTDTETSNWTWDSTANAYYWHRFFHHQPDLNFDNPRVMESVLRVMRFWLDMGVDGMRLDAIPYLIEREGTNCENLPETHQILRSIRKHLDERYEGRMLLAEANAWPADVRPYFGDGDECHMAFHFPLMPRMFMAVLQEDRHPITEILRQTPDIPESCQWALFLRNHDELTLQMVTDDERDYMYKAYAGDPRMRVNIGIRRRLAPLMENDRARIQLLTGLLLSLPGTPIIYYGDEIGMGDNIYLGDRNSVRTPMQWTGDRNAGFSRADPARLFAPVIMDPIYGYQAVNVEAEERSPASLLNWTKRLIAVRKQHRTFGRGTLEFLQPANRKVLAYIRRFEQEQILCVANLARTVQPVELDLSGLAGLTPVEMLGGVEFPRIGDGQYVLTLAPHGFYWFVLEKQPAPITARVPAQEVPTIVHGPALLASGVWETLFDGYIRTLIERDSLAPFLKRQPWFEGRSRQMRSVRFADWTLLQRSSEPTFLTFVEVEYVDPPAERYFVPLALRSGAAGHAIVSTNPSAVLAHITGARTGVLCDAAVDDPSMESLLALIEAHRELTTRRGTTISGIRAASAPNTATPSPAQPVRLARFDADQGNTKIVFGGRDIVLKLFRIQEAGPHPDYEITRYLTEDAGFSRVPRLFGVVESTEAEATVPSTLTMGQSFTESQANGWDHAIANLDRYLEYASTERLSEEEVGVPRIPLADLERTNIPEVIARRVGAYLGSADKLGRRTAELHSALARSTENPAFAPAPLSTQKLDQLTSAALDRAQEVVSLLERKQAALPQALAEKASVLLADRERLFDALQAPVRILTAEDGDSVGRSSWLTTRIHGDFHLGRVLWAEEDFIFVDFEGEPGKTLQDRRAKQLPLKDVAGMLRSFSYAAHAAALGFTTRRGESFESVEPSVRLWQDWVSAAFLKGYLNQARPGGFLPEQTRETDLLLRLFGLDKALWELRNELNNRPDWVQIPLSGIIRQLGD